MEVTDEIFEIAIKAYQGTQIAYPQDRFPMGMKAALEAVFDHISQQGRKVEPEDNQDGWIECNSGTQIFCKKEDGSTILHGYMPNFAIAYRIPSSIVKLEKKTLLDFAIHCAHQRDTKIRFLTPIGIIEIIGDYYGVK